MADHFVDWSAFQRLDNATVVDFLTSTAGVLQEHGLITNKDTDNLPLAISGINSSPESRDRPILPELDRQHAEFLAVLAARYGMSGFCLNLVRHSLRGSVAETQRVVNEWGEALLKRADLLFNRPFHVQAGGTVQKRILYSTVLVDFAAILAQAADRLAAVAEQLASMNPHAMAGEHPEDRKIDLGVAQALGFRTLVEQSLPLQAELGAKRDLAHTMITVTSAAHEVAVQLIANADAGSSYAMAAACEWLKSECERLAHLELPQSDNLTIWEVRRRNLAACLVSINESLRALKQASLDAVSADLKPTTMALAGNDAAKRRIAFDLMSAGAAPGVAWDATTALFRYLADQKVQARQILPGELPRIHPGLLPKSLATLVELERDQSVMQTASLEKASTAGRAKRLVAAFAKTTAQVAPVLLAMMFVGCGLKTRPENDAPELRPDIPFRDAAATEAPKVDGQTPKVQTQDALPAQPAPTQVSPATQGP